MFLDNDKIKHGTYCSGILVEPVEHLADGGKKARKVMYCVFSLLEGNDGTVKGAGDS